MNLRIIASVTLSLAASASHAQDIQLPGNAIEQTSITATPDSYQIATGPWDNALPTLTTEGAVTKTAWRISGAGLTTLQILRPLREQLTLAGYETLYTCDAVTCGGFDFRFAMDVLPPPAMQINLGDFRYLSARKTTSEGNFFLSLFVSRTGRASYVQIVLINPESVPATRVATAGSAVRATTHAPAASNSEPVNLTQSLNTIGRATLNDLVFATGSAQLTDAPSAALQELANYLLAQPDLTVALVGHTDSSGSLDTNISLSKRRARSVLELLVTQYAIPRRQLDAQGMGYLSPIANNRTDAGRNANRRVEVIITSTQ